MNTQAGKPKELDRGRFGLVGNVETVKQNSIQHGLRHGIARNEMTLCYPSKFENETGAVIAPEALSRWRSLIALGERRSYPAQTILFREEQFPSTVMLLLEGTVTLSMNSTGGKRLIVGNAKPGEILGLDSAVSGFAYQTTARTRFTCLITCIKRARFLNFLLLYPVACQNVARELSVENKLNLERLRTLGFALKSQEKLARLLLSWCGMVAHSGKSVRIQCPFTHEEIGEHIGISRETISRCMKDLRKRGLLVQHGTILIIPDCDALSVYGGIGSAPVPPKVAA